MKAVRKNRVAFSFFSHRQLTMAVLIGGLLMASRGWAQPLTFVGLQNQEPIGNYYDGGFGSGPGPNYGITFGPEALAVTGNVDAPDGDTVAMSINGPSVVMNDPAGFNTAFSFYYSASEPGEVAVYSGVNGTGSLLTSFPLFVTNPPGQYPWTGAGSPFSGTAQSVDFTGTANDIRFVYVSPGSLVLPEPTSVGLLISASVGLFVRRLRRLPPGAT